MYTVHFNVGDSSDVTLGGVTEEGFKKLQEIFGDDIEGMKDYLTTAVHDWEFDEDPEGVIVASMSVASVASEYGCDGLCYVEVLDEDGDSVFTMDGENYGDLEIVKNEDNAIRRFLKECKEKNVKYVFCQYYRNGDIDLETEIYCDEFEPEKLQLVASELDEETGIFDNDICIYPYSFVYDGEEYCFDEEGGASYSFLDVFMLDEDGNTTLIIDEDEEEYKRIEFEDFMQGLNG